MQSSPSRPRTMALLKPVVSAADQRRSTSSQVVSFLSLGLINSDRKAADRCHICQEELEGNLLTSKKHTCRFCQMPTCAAHSMGRRAKEGEPVRICDECDLNEKRKEINFQYQKEVEVQNMRILALEEATDRSIRENQVLASTVASLESQLAAKTNENALSLSRLHSQKQELLEKIAKADQAKSELMAAIEEKNTSTMEVKLKCEEQQVEARVLQGEVGKLVARKEELWVHSQELRGKQVNSLTAKYIEPILCDICAQKLKEFQHARNHSSTTGGHDRSASIYSAPSFLEPASTPPKSCLLF